MGNEITSVIGIDPGTRFMGVCKMNKDQTYDIHLITSSSANTKPLRYQHLLTETMAIVETSSVVFIEDYAFRANQRQSSLATMGEIGGLLRYMSWRKTGLWPVVIGIGQWKKWLTGVGKGKIEDFKLQLFKRRGVEFESVDEGVAFLIAEIGYALVFGADHGFVGYHKDVLKGIRKKLTSGKGFIRPDLLSDV